mgnify:FL=1
MENFDEKLSKEEVEELKDEIKARLSSNDEEEEEEELTSEEIAEDIKHLNTEEELTEYLEEVHNVDIAESFEEIESDEELLRVFNLLSDENKAEILEEADEDLQKRILYLIPEDEVLEIFSYMSPDDIADILGYIGFTKSKSLLNQMKRSEANKLRELLGYADDSAGGIMTTQYIAFKKNLNIKEVMEKIKLIAPRTEYIETIFVLDLDGTVIGEADLRDILIADENTLLEDITNENILSVRPNDDQEEVARLVSRYGLKVVPVINKRKNLLGIITIDDVVDVIQEENTEDILKLAGAGDDESLSTNLSESVKKRLPWLLINLVTAFLASFTVGLFSKTIDTVVALAVAMPIVSGMGGNAGTQSLAVTIRSIALGEYYEDENFEVSIRYVFLGFLNGIVLGIICGIIIYFMFGNKYLSLIIFLSMIGNCIIASLVGYLIPIGLKAIKVDPAMASAVLLTTITDVCGFFLFLGLATIYLHKLI